jgi:hypothetical protein
MRIRGPTATRPHHDPAAAAGQLDDAARHHARARESAAFAGTVGVVEDDLVAPTERDRAQHGVHTGRGIVDEDEIVAPRSEKGGDRGRRLAQPERPAGAARHIRELAQEKPRRLPLDLVANGLLRREHASRRRPHRAVVQVHGTRLEQPLFAHGMAEGRHSVFRYSMTARRCSSVK